MEKRILWDNGIKTCLQSFTKEHMEDFLELLDYIQDHSIEDVICENTREDASLWEWLYTKDKVELNDIKRELSRKIERVKCVGFDEFGKMLDGVGKQISVKTLILLWNCKDDFCIATIPEYYTGLRKYLIMEKKSEFCKDLPDCFPNLYFVEDIGRTINTLNRKFEEIRSEIVEHLSKLDAYHQSFLVLSAEKNSYQEVAKRFSMDMGIECSTQAGREKVQELKETCFNTEKGQKETVICELHTKFKRFNIDRDKQDRIYFFPGKKGGVGGKVIIKHIGGHL